MAKQVVVLGGDTAIGRALAEIFEERDVDVDVRFAALTERLGPGLDAIDQALLEGGDLFVLTALGAMAPGILEGLLRLGKPVLDMRDGGARAEDPLIWPGLDPDAGADLAAASVARIPIGLASPVVAVVQALAEHSPRRVGVCTYESAAVEGQAGMDELSAQVRGVFTMKTEDPERFPASLAFDVIPSAAGPDGDPEAADRALEAAIEAGLTAVGAGEVTVAASRALVPAFSAEAAFVEVELAEPIEAEAAAARLEAGRTLRWVKNPLIPSLDAVGRDDALVGRIQVRGRFLRVWIAADRLRRGSATQAVLAVERWSRGPGDTMSKPASDA